MSVVSSKEVYAMLNSTRLPQDIIQELANKNKIRMNSPIFATSPKNMGVGLNQ